MADNWWVKFNVFISRIAGAAYRSQMIVNVAKLFKLELDHYIQCSMEQFEEKGIDQEIAERFGVNTDIMNLAFHGHAPTINTSDIGTFTPHLNHYLSQLNMKEMDKNDQQQKNDKNVKKKKIKKRQSNHNGKRSEQNKNNKL